MRTRLLVALAALLGLLAGGAVTAYADAPANACDSVYTSNSIAALKNYTDCRDDRLERQLTQIQNAQPSASPSASPTPTKAPTPTPSSSVTPKPSPTPTPTVVSPTPTPTPTPTVPAGSCVGPADTPGGPDPFGGCWPGPQNTGYPHGLPGDTRKPVTLTDYTGPQEIKTCTTIENKIVPWLVISASNGAHTPDKPCVTIKNSLIKGSVFTGDISQGPVVISDSEFDLSGDLPYYENAGRYNFFTYRVNSHGGEGVIKCAAYCETKDSWVHGMTLGGAYHYNAIGGNGIEGGAWVIDHNWASCGDWESTQSGVQSDAGCSAAIGFYGDFGPIRNITINRNYLVSTFDTSASGRDRQAAYCLNPGYYPGKPYPAPSNVNVTDNIFSRGGSGKCGVYGPTNSLNRAGAQNGNTWSGNRYDDGTAIARVEE